ncbi:unnamed protein product [Effrenium voratum]|nr:unnamed protein product [Effrenium voratum]
MDALWQHPETRAVFYVGNQTAATNLSLLQKHGVTHVVNCTDSMPNYHENYPSGIKYHRFDISSFHRRVKSDADAARFVQPMLDFVSSALADGKNVMVHCLAGAHRAGTTGCMCLMYFAQLGAKGVQRSDEEAKEVVERIKVAVSSKGGDFQAAWMDSDDEKEAAKLSEKPSGPGSLLLEDPLKRGPAIELTFIEVPYWWVEADLRRRVQDGSCRDCAVLVVDVCNPDSFQAALTRGKWALSAGLQCQMASGLVVLIGPSGCIHGSFFQSQHLVQVLSFAGPCGRATPLPQGMPS